MEYLIIVGVFLVLTILVISWRLECLIKHCSKMFDSDLEYKKSNRDVLESLVRCGRSQMEINNFSINQMKIMQEEIEGLKTVVKHLVKINT